MGELNYVRGYLLQQNKERKLSSNVFVNNDLEFGDPTMIEEPLLIPDMDFSGQAECDDIGESCDEKPLVPKPMDFN